MITMKITHKPTQTTISVTAESIVETSDKMVAAILEENWDEKDLKLDCYYPEVVMSGKD